MFYKINTQFMKYSDEETISSLLDDLETQSNEITVLDLSLNTYTPPVFLKICQKIRNLKNCKHIILESILDSLNYDEMCDIMTYISEYFPISLESLELPSNALSCNFPPKFGTFLSACKLKVLNLHNCGLGEDGLKKIANYLSKIEDKSNLESLDLSKNRINVICPEFANILSEFQFLSRIILNANTIEEKSMANFLKNLKNKKIRILNLTDNFVCGDAIEPLGDLFISNEITELYLQDIKVDEGDINKLLKKFLKKNTSSNENLPQPIESSFKANHMQLGLPGSLDEPKQNLILDISCNNFDQECIELLIKLTETFKFDKLVIFENDFSDCEELRRILISENCRLIDEEEEEDYEKIDESIAEMIKQL